MANARISGRKGLGMSAAGDAGPMRGWRDTFGADPNGVSRMRRRFEPPAVASVSQKYLYHRHTLEHEDNAM
jgi:FtsP/CotA-like multicopper oxidase with cupredoxin domain